MRARLFHPCLSWPYGPRWRPPRPAARRSAPCGGHCPACRERRSRSNVTADRSRSRRRRMGNFTSRSRSIRGPTTPSACRGALLQAVVTEIDAGGAGGRRHGCAIRARPGWHFDDGERLAPVDLLPLPRLRPPATSNIARTRNGEASRSATSRAASRRGAGTALSSSAASGATSRGRKRAGTSSCPIARAPPGLRALAGQHPRRRWSRGRWRPRPTNGDIDVQRALGGAGLLSATAGNITSRPAEGPGRRGPGSTPTAARSPCGS